MDSLGSLRFFSEGGKPIAESGMHRDENVLPALLLSLPLLPLNKTAGLSSQGFRVARRESKWGSDWGDLGLVHFTSLLVVSNVLSSVKLIRLLVFSRLLLKDS